MDQSELRQGFFYQSDIYPHQDNSNHFYIPANQAEDIASDLKSDSKEPPKKKGIYKSPKNSGEKIKKPKRKKDDLNLSSMGRPSNQNIQIMHLRENKSFNDIIYHFSRFTIFLKLKQGSQSSAHSLQLQNNQSAWMSQTQIIMNVQNFPDYNQEKPAFLLHPNSLHYVFQYQKQNNNKIQYSSQEVKFMFFAFLNKRKMLSTIIYSYVNDYWSDIISLVNNPQGDNQVEAEPKDKDKELQIEIEDIPTPSQNRENINNNIEDQKEGDNSSKAQGKKNKKKQSKDHSEMMLLKKELQEDDSIAAYQIACYLHACCQKFELTILMTT